MNLGRYDYELEKEWLFSDEGQRLFLKIRDRAFKLMDLSGAASLGKIISGFSGDTFQMIACVDRLVELEEVQLVYPNAAVQNNIYRMMR